MILGFKEQFAPFVEDGSKTHTLRAVRRGDRPLRVGDRLDCYTNVRTKRQRLLGRWPCTNIEPARLKFIKHGIGYILQITIGGYTLDATEAERFAWVDGFRGSYSPMHSSLFQMSNFWIAEHNLKDALGAVWEGELNHWDYNRPMEKD